MTGSELRACRDLARQGGSRRKQPVGIGAGAAAFERLRNQSHIETGRRVVRQECDGVVV